MGRLAVAGPATACHGLPRPATACHGLPRPAAACRGLYGLPRPAVLSPGLPWPGVVRIRKNPRNMRLFRSSTCSFLLLITRLPPASCSVTLFAHECAPACLRTTTWCRWKLRTTSRLRSTTSKLRSTASKLRSTASKLRSTTSKLRSTTSRCWPGSAFHAERVHPEHH